MPLLRILIDRKGKDYLHPMLPIPICRSRLKKGIVGVIVYGALVLSLIYIGIHQMKKGELRSIVFFSILLALGVREVTFSSFFSEREYDDTLFPDNG